MKTWNIFSANKTIENLNAKLLQLQTQLDAQTPEFKAEVMKALEQENAELKTALEDKVGLVANIEQLNKDKTELSQLNTEMSVKLETLTNNIEQLKAEHTTALDKVVKEHIIKVETLEKKLSDLNDQLLSKAVSVNRKVAEQIASLGISEGEIPAVSGETPLDIINQYVSMPAGKERIEFGAKHRNTIEQFLKGI